MRLSPRSEIVRQLRKRGLYAMANDVEHGNRLWIGRPATVLDGKHAITKGYRSWRFLDPAAVPHHEEREGKAERPLPTPIERMLREPRL